MFATIKLFLFYNISSDVWNGSILVEDRFSGFCPDPTNCPMSSCRKHATINVSSLSANLPMWYCELYLMMRDWLGMISFREKISFLCLLLWYVDCYRSRLTFHRGFSVYSAIGLTQSWAFIVSSRPGSQSLAFIIHSCGGSFIKLIFSCCLFNLHEHQASSTEY